MKRLAERVPGYGVEASTGTEVVRFTGSDAIKEEPLHVKVRRNAPEIQLNRLKSHHKQKPEVPWGILGLLAAGSGFSWDALQRPLCSAFISPW
jgi:hypothetical protein